MIKKTSHDKLGLKHINSMTILPTKAENRTYLAISSPEFVIQLRLAEIGVERRSTHTAKLTRAARLKRVNHLS